MTYNRRKINTKGEKAPNGYHYMADDSLMSDEEHEKKYGKSFAKTLDCQDCKTIVKDHGPPNELTLANPFTGDSTIVTNSWFVGAGGQAYSELAKYDNFFWTQGTPPGSSFVQSVVQDDIREFEIGPNCTVTYIRSVLIPTLVVNKGSGMCAKDSSTLIAGSVAFGYGGPGFPSSNQNICEIDISGTTAVYTPLFQATGIVAGDIVYIPSSNTIVASIYDSFNNTGGGGSIFIKHFDMSGTVLGQAILPVGVNGFSMYSYEDEVYIANNQSSGYTYRFVLQNHALVPIITMTNFAGADAASSPNCDNSPFDGDKYTWDCETVVINTRSGPTLSTNACVQKTYPQVGQFLTEQDCINSGCVPQPPTIQCSRCDSGYPVSNSFPGAVCPPGWQPASLGNPCKPPTGPIPTGPVSG
jgi:hypothetical protein